MRAQRRFLTFAAPAAAALLALSACTAATPGTDGAGGQSTQLQQSSPVPDAAATRAQAILSGAGLGALNAAEPAAVVDRLEAIPVAKRPAGLSASITGDAVELKDAEGQSASLGLDRFYLSVAPYLTTTHECTYHAPVGCRGELGSTPLKVSIKDTETGEELVSTSVTTADNGFAGFWLPKDRTVSVKIEAEGKSGTVTTGTSAADPTCLTTLRLS